MNKITFFFYIFYNGSSKGLAKLASANYYFYLQLMLV